MGPEPPEGSMWWPSQGMKCILGSLISPAPLVDATAAWKPQVQLVFTMSSFSPSAPHHQYRKQLGLRTGGQVMMGYPEDRHTAQKAAQSWECRQ